MLTMLGYLTKSDMRADQRHFRKTARTRIYTAIYGPQDCLDSDGQKRLGVNTKRSNQPWLDESRFLPQNWSIEGILHIVKECWVDAKFDAYRQNIILSDLNTLCKSKGHDIVGLSRTGGII